MYNSVITLIVFIIVFTIIRIREFYTDFKKDPVGKRCRIKGTDRKGTCTEFIDGKICCVVMDNDASHITLPINELELVLYEL